MFEGALARLLRRRDDHDWRRRVREHIQVGRIVLVNYVRPVLHLRRDLLKGLGVRLARLRILVQLLGGRLRERQRRCLQRLPGQRRLVGPDHVGDRVHQHLLSLLRELLGLVLYETSLEELARQLVGAVRGLDLDAVRSVGEVDVERQNGFFLVWVFLVGESLNFVFCLELDFQMGVDLGDEALLARRGLRKLCDGSVLGPWLGLGLVGVMVAATPAILVVALMLVAFVVLVVFKALLRVALGALSLIVLLGVVLLLEVVAVVLVVVVVCVGVVLVAAPLLGLGVGELLALGLGKEALLVVLLVVLCAVVLTLRELLLVLHLGLAGVVLGLHLIFRRLAAGRSALVGVLLVKRVGLRALVLLRRLLQGLLIQVFVAVVVVLLRVHVRQVRVRPFAADHLGLLRSRVRLKVTVTLLKGLGARLVWQGLNLRRLHLFVVGALLGRRVGLELLLELNFFPAIVVPTLALVCVCSVGWRVLAIATALGLIGALFVLVLRVGVGLLRTRLGGRLKVGVSFLV